VFSILNGSCLAGLIRKKRDTKKNQNHFMEKLHVSVTLLERLNGLHLIKRYFKKKKGFGKIKSLK